MADAPVNGNSAANGHSASSSQERLKRRKARHAFNRQQREMIANATMDTWMKQRELVENLTSFSRQWFSQMSDPRRNLYDECGWPGDPGTSPGGAAGLSVDLFRTLYDREPLATKVVEIYPNECWQQTPTVFEDMDTSKVTAFEEAWDNLTASIRGENSCYQDEHGSPIWEKLKRADIVCGIGSFGVLLLGIDDGKNLQEPLDGVMTTNAHGEGFSDGPMTTDEEKALLNPQPRWSAGVVGNKADRAIFGPSRGIPVGADRLGAEPLSDGQKMVVNSWREEREREWVFNAQGGQYVKRNAERDRGFHNSATEPTTDRAKDSQGREIFGTDKQYDDIGYGIGMPPPDAGYSLSGTDEQYFGVQFGPSEQPAPSTEPGVYGDGNDGVGTGAKQQRGAGDNRRPRQRPRLLFLKPYGEDMVQIVRYEWNIRNPRFGLPVMYRITLNDPREAHSGVGLPLATVFVHWSRVIHIADNLRSSEVFGVPRLRPVLNPILDVQKVRGAGAEGYYKSCFAGLQFVTHPQLGPDAYVDVEKTKTTVEEYQNGLQRALVSVGGQWSTIAPSVVDPTPHINAGIEAICIAINCPVPVFKGYEIGEQASTNNAVEWNKRKHERCWNFITPKLIVPLVDRLIQVGVLPRPGDAKSKVENLRATQPWTSIKRRQGGWLVTNWRRPMVNANPEGHNQYNGGSKLPHGGTLKRVSADHYQYQNAEGGKFIITKVTKEDGAADTHWNAHEQNGPTPHHYGHPFDSGQTLGEVLHYCVGKNQKEPTDNAEWEKLPVKPPEKKTGVAAIRAEVAKYDEKQLEGLGVWVNDELGIAVVDRMDWYDKSEDVDPAAEIGKVAERQWGKERVIYQNEGPCPKGQGWITLNVVSPSVGDTASAKDEQARTGQAGGPDQEAKGWTPPTASDKADGGAEPWEAGQTGTMTGQTSALFISDGGYSVEWPDVEALTKSDKATLANTYTTALSAYMQGGCEALMPFKEYLVHVWGWEEEQAQEMIDAAKQMHADQDTLATPPMVQGHPVEAPDGSQAAADSQDAKDAAKQKADAMTEIAKMKQPVPGADETAAPGAKSGMMKGAKVGAAVKPASGQPKPGA